MDKLKRVSELIRRIAERERLATVSYAIAKNDKIVAAETLGQPGPPAFTIMSISKTIQNVALWTLIVDGTLALETPIAAYLPAFGMNGKEAVTVEQVMLHTGGFAIQPLAFPDCANPVVRRAAYAGWSLESEPGRAYCYHPSNAAWVLADVAEAITGVSYHELVNDRLLAPLGLFGIDLLALALPVHEQVAVRDVLFDLSAEQVRQLPPFQLDPVTGFVPMLDRLNIPEARAIGMPGSGITGSAAALALFYQALLSDRTELWDAAIRADATTRVRLKAPDTWGFAINRTLGFLSAGEVKTRRGEAGFFGSGVSARCFGHGGLGGQMAWADPTSGLSFALLTDTVTFTPLEQSEWGAEISTAVSAAFTD